MLAMTFTLRKWVLQSKNAVLGHMKMGRKELGRKIKEGKCFFPPFLSVVGKKLTEQRRWLSQYHEENHFRSSRDMCQCQRHPGVEPPFGQQAALKGEVSSEQRLQPHRSQPSAPEPSFLLPQPNSTAFPLRTHLRSKLGDQWPN